MTVLKADKSVNTYPASKPAQKYPTSKPAYKYPTSKPAYKYPTSKPAYKYPTKPPKSREPSATPVFTPTIQPTPLSLRGNSFRVTQTLYNIAIANLTTPNGTLALKEAILKSLNDTSAVILQQIDILQIGGEGEGHEEEEKHGVEIQYRVFFTSNNPIVTYNKLISSLSANVKNGFFIAALLAAAQQLHLQGFGNANTASGNANIAQLETHTPPTSQPTYVPTYAPTSKPTYLPTYAPSSPTYTPTFKPSSEPTHGKLGEDVGTVKIESFVDSSPSDSKKTEIAIGVVTSVVFTFCFVIALYVFYRRRKQRMQKEVDGEKTEYGMERFYLQDSHDIEDKSISKSQERDSFEMTNPAI
jgi:hypothetical protein